MADCKKTLEDAKKIPDFKDYIEFIGMSKEKYKIFKEVVKETNKQINLEMAEKINSMLNKSSINIKDKIGAINESLNKYAKE